MVKNNSVKYWAVKILINLLFVAFTQIGFCSSISDAFEKLDERKVERDVLLIKFSQAILNCENRKAFVLLIEKFNDESKFNRKYGSFLACKTEKYGDLKIVRIRNRGGYIDSHVMINMWYDSIIQRASINLYTDCNVDEFGCDSFDQGYRRFLNKTYNLNFSLSSKVVMNHENVNPFSKCLNAKRINNSTDSSSLALLSSLDTLNLRFVYLFIDTQFTSDSDLMSVRLRYLKREQPLSLIYHLYTIMDTSLLLKLAEKSPDARIGLAAACAYISIVVERDSFSEKEAKELLYNVLAKIDELRVSEIINSKHDRHYYHMTPEDIIDRIKDGSSIFQ